MMLRFDHFNFNVLDLERSLAFYREALELTWLRDRTEPYDLGEQEFHLAFRTDRFDELLARHKAMGCVCYENPAMGIYFISDPDGYWIEIVPEK